MLFAILPLHLLLPLSSMELLQISTGKRTKMTAIYNNVSALRSPNCSRVASNMLGTVMKHLSSGTCADSPEADADFSAESTKLAAAQILSQASTAMLAQANQSQQGVLNLLR